MGRVDLPAKTTLRRTLLAARRELGVAERAADAAALARWAGELPVSGQIVCGYVPLGTEPGSSALLDALAGAGARVLVPLVRGQGPLCWARWSGAADLVPAALGLREPRGTELDPAVLGEAAVVLVPALAVDARGARLGRGAGYYDRSLGLAAPGARLVGVVRDAEVLPRVPTERHDVPLGWVLTPAGGLAPLGG